MSELLDLIERCKAAKGPDKDLDRAIAMAAGLGPKAPKSRSDGDWEPNNGGQHAYGYDSPDEATGWVQWPEADRYAPPPRYHSCKRYTSSLDAIVALIEAKLPGKNWHLARGKLRADEPLYGAVIMEGTAEIAGAETNGGAALCMSIAFLLALSHKHPETT